MQYEFNVVCKSSVDVKNTHSVTFHVIVSLKLRKTSFCQVLYYLFHVSIGYLAVCTAEIYELEVS